MEAVGLRLEVHVEGDSARNNSPFWRCSSASWAAFAHSGNPNHKGLPKWPRFSTEERATMVFDKECKVANDPHGEERKALGALRTA